MAEAAADTREAPVKDRTGQSLSDVAGEEGAQGPAHVEDKNVKKLPTVVLVVGMAGSGKTRYMHRMNIAMHEQKIPSFFINLDPAVLEVPYGVNIDIRDTVSHKEVMKQYNLGPNGAIITSLNLFATRFDQVLGYIESRQDELEYVFIDTPGQIEVFTWSASGQIIMETLASTFPTVVCYVMDAARSCNPTTFMSNMMYSCGILYRTQLPLLIAMNKIDIADHREALKWMHDSEAFEDAMASEGSYSAQLQKSMAGVMQEFYQNIRACGISAVTGEGVPAMLAELKECRADYVDLFLPELKKKMTKRRADQAAKEAADIEKLHADIESTQGFKVVASKGDAWDGPELGGNNDVEARFRNEDEEEADAAAYVDEYEVLNPSKGGFEDDPQDDGAPPLHLLNKMDAERAARQSADAEDEEAHQEFVAMLRARAAEEAKAKGEPPAN